MVDPLSCGKADSVHPYQMFFDSVVEGAELGLTAVFTLVIGARP
jgi:hypothetical protein